MIAHSYVLSQESLHDPFLFLYSGVKLRNIVNNMVTHVLVIFDLDLIVGKSAHAPSDPNFTAGFWSIYIVVLNKFKKSNHFFCYILMTVLKSIVLVVFKNTKNFSSLLN